MASWIKVDGTEQEVHPGNGVEFDSTELNTYVDGSLTGITLTGHEAGGLYMFIDEQSVTKGKLANRVATEVLHQHRRDHLHTTVYGDVVVAGLDEIGDE